jgi:DNA polymerase III delta prime subunit
VVLRERREHHKSAEQPPRDRDRALMLRRVRNRWIKSVLEQSLAEEARIRFGLARRPEVIAPLGMVRRRTGQAFEPLQAGTSVSAVFEEVDSGLLILGAPGSGKTTGLLELARDLLRKPKPIRANRCRWSSTCPRGLPGACLLPNG